MVDLDDGVDCTFSKFADDTNFIYHELESEKLDKWLIHQMPAWAERNLIKCDTRKCRRKNNPRHLCSLGASALENSFAGHVQRSWWTPRGMQASCVPWGQRWPTVSWAALGRRLQKVKGGDPSLPHSTS